MDGIDPYHSSPPHPSQSILVPTKTQGPFSTVTPISSSVPRTEEQSSQPKPKRVKKVVSSKKSPHNIVQKGETSSKKRKSRTIES